ncbi:helix-turn-helix transcriptional regulator [Dyella sp. 20L07]|uniref:helix-turn-helix transcriptional regulator n=1 Tax=Dyella sp. 20L07 TaxID=3384240 RepID=UPI003D2DE620
MKPNTRITEHRLLRTKDVLEILGVSRTTLYRLVQSEQLPPPLKLGRSTFWPEREIAQLIASMIEQREERKRHRARHTERVQFRSRELSVAA